MGQSTTSGDKVQNKHARDDRQGNFRLEGTPQRSRRRKRTKRAAHHPTDHFAPTSTFQDRNNGITSHGSHHGNVSFTEHVKNTSHHAGGGDLDGRTGTHVRLEDLTDSQAQAFRSMQTAFSIQPYSHQQTANSLPMPLPMTGVSAHQNNEHHGFRLPLLPRASHSPDIARMDFGHGVGITSSNTPWQKHHANDLPCRQFSTLPQRDTSVVGTQSSHLSSTVKAALSMPQTPRSAVANEAPLPKISSPSSVSFQTLQPFQLSPLDYIYTNHTAPAPFDLQLLNRHWSGSVQTLLGGYFGFMYMLVLDRLTVPRENLEGYGYRTSSLTDNELMNRRRCLACGKYWGKISNDQHQARKSSCKATKSTKQLPAHFRERTLMPENRRVAMVPKKSEAAQTNDSARTLKCLFHKGDRITIYPPQSGSEVEQSAKPRKYWSCCKEMPNPQPCAGNEYHTFPSDNIATLAAQWQHYPTPQIPLGNTGSRRVAVALDCEMGVSEAKIPELIRVTMIDYFTTETLIDKLVYPHVPMIHLSTRFSGVTWDMLNTASARGECFQGRTAALEEIWKFVGPETIVIAHSGHNDLSSLRWVHHRVVDTYLLDAIPERERLRKLKKLENQRKAADKEDHQPIELQQGVHNTDHSGTNKPRSTSQNEDNKSEGLEVKAASFKLKVLVKNRLGRDIQTGKSGHDSLEDAVAARDLAHWHVSRILEGADKDKVPSAR